MIAYQFFQTFKQSPSALQTTLTTLTTLLHSNQATPFRIYNTIEKTLC